MGSDSRLREKENAMTTPSSPPTPQVGWLTPEHLQTVLKQVLCLLVTLGVLQTSDAANLNSQLAACITTAFVFAVNAWQVVTFLRGQVALKQGQAPGKSSPPLPLLLLAVPLAATHVLELCL
jgi:hypothetical protein